MPRATIHDHLTDLRAQMAEWSAENPDLSPVNEISRLVHHSLDLYDDDVLALGPDIPASAWPAPFGKGGAVTATYSAAKAYLYTKLVLEEIAPDGS